MKLRKTATDATGAPISAETVYTPVQPYMSGQAVYNAGSRVRGDHPAVAANPSLWLSETTDPDLLRKLRATASMPTYVSHKAPRPDPIPTERQAVASESFTDGRSGRYVRAGHVLRDDDPVVKANKRLFHRPAQSLEAA